jgi:excisionase family DNA binding protein
MNVEEVAAYLSFSVDTIYNKVQSRDIPHTRIGNALRFTKRSIDTWLDRNTLTPAESLYDQVAKLLNRHHLQQWLEGRGVDWKTLTEDELVELARKAIEDLRQHGGTP